MHDRDQSREPGSTTSEGRTTERCAVCEARIDTTEWHPIRGRADDGTFRVYTFCSEECFGTWENGESNDAE